MQAKKLSAEELEAIREINREFAPSGRWVDPLLDHIAALSRELEERANAQGIAEARLHEASAFLTGWTFADYDKECAEEAESLAAQIDVLLLARQPRERAADDGHQESADGVADRQHGAGADGLKD